MATSLERSAPQMRLTLRGEPIHVDTTNHAGFWQEVAQGSWEPATFAIFERFLDPEHSYLDIGCWIGPTLLYGCQLAKAAWGLEPDPLAFAELQQNMQLNRPLSDNVHPLNLCIATQSGRGRLRQPWRGRRFNLEPAPLGKRKPIGRSRR